MRKFISSLVLVLFALASLGGCAASTSSGGGGNPDRVTYDDLEGLSSSNLLDALQQIRPNWLRTRGISSFSGEPDPIVVYVDNVRFGAVSSLSSFRLEGVQSVQRISATSATQRFGTGHAGGALLVVTRQGG